MASTLGKQNPFRYRGYVYDEDTELYYLRTRYYNPLWGRFINTDEVIGKTEALLSHNLFEYCRNNPKMMEDSAGTWPNWNVFSGAIDLIIVGAAAIATAATVLTGGIAAPALVGVLAWGTAIVGSAAITVGVTEVHEAFTGKNAIKDGAFNGNTSAYYSARTALKYSAEGLTFATSTSALAASALQNAGKVAIKTPTCKVLNNPQDPFTQGMPKPGQVGKYLREIPIQGYSKISVTRLPNGFYQLADGHHKTQALRKLGYSRINVFLVK